MDDVPEGPDEASSNQGSNLEVMQKRRLLRATFVRSTKRSRGVRVLEWRSDATEAPTPLAI